MKMLYKNDNDYILLPSDDPFVNTQREMLERMGYVEKEIEDTVPTDDTTENTNKEKTYTTSDGTVYTESELKEILNKI